MYIYVNISFPPLNEGFRDHLDKSIFYCLLYLSKTFKPIGTHVIMITLILIKNITS